jgi:hypothetical protein
MVVRRFTVATSGTFMTYLSASELAELVGCRRNQKSRMIAWLTQQNWAYVIDVTGQPKVARAYHDKKMGIIDPTTQERYAEGPDLEAFTSRTNRR